jgi:hypothetical protein
MPVQLSKVPGFVLEAFLHLHEMAISAFIKTREVERGEVNLEPDHGIRLHYFAVSWVREVLIYPCLITKGFGERRG